MTLTITPANSGTAVVNKFLSRSEAQRFIDDLYAEKKIKVEEWRRLSDILSTPLTVVRG